MVLHLDKPESPLPKDWLCQTGPVVLEKIMKMWRRYRQMYGRTMGDQKRWLEISAQLSLKANFSVPYKAEFTYHNRIPWVPRRQLRTPSPVRDAAPEESPGLRTGALQGWPGWCRSSMRPTRRRASDLAEKKSRQFLSSISTQIYHKQSSIIIFLPCTNSNGRTHQGFLSQEMYIKRATLPTKPAYKTLAWPTNQPEQV